MPRLRRLSCLFALFALLGSVPGAVSTALAVANHVVISEFATRGPSDAFDEFVELYNPTANAVNINGWKLEYKAGGSTIWNLRATLPSGATIPAHGFYLIAPSAYVGTTTPDFVSAAWSAGASDNAHWRILDGASATIDKVGWGTAIDPEGTATPNHGGTGNNNSVERKASSLSTAASMATGGADELEGNGEDTDNNAANFVVQTNGRKPQNSANPPEPAFSMDGSGTGACAVAPLTVYKDTAVPSLTFTFSQSDPYTLTDIEIIVPPTWTWSQLVADVDLAGTGFAAANVAVNGNQILVSAAALAVGAGGTLTISDLTSPATPGTSSFSVKTAVASGTLTQIAAQPAVNVLNLVPIVAVHVNDASGVPVAPYQVGAEVTVSGIVTANNAVDRTDIYMQDETAGINLFSFTLPPFTIQPGDHLTVTGSILQFRGLTEIEPNFALVTLESSGNPVPDPQVITCTQVNQTFKPDFTEPDEGRLIRINGVTYNAMASTITDASGTTQIFIPNTFPPAPSVFDVVGILKQFKPGTPAPGPPYTADYEIVPRTPDDIIAHPGPILLTAPFEDNIQQTSVDLNWTTNVASSSIVEYGLTSALGSSVTDNTAVTSHSITVPGLTAATIYHYRVGSADGNGTNYSTTRMFITASPAPATGDVNVYFTKSVDHSVAWLTQATGNQNPTPLLVSRLDAAQFSIDAALYSLSGTPGQDLANALVAAKNRGVKVRVIAEFDNLGSVGFNTLISNGVPFIDDKFDAVNAGTGLHHNKFFVIDGRGGPTEGAWVWTGSWNPTDPGTNNDMQNVIEFQDKSLAVAFTREFEEMWGSSTETPNSSISRFGARKQDDTPHRFSIGGRDVESYFSPSDDATSRIIATINAAQEFIGFQLLTFTRTDIATALVTKDGAGVPVRGNLDDDSDTGSQYSFLNSNGVDVRLKTGASGLLHHKYLLVDALHPHGNPVTLTGSHNWSNSAENTNNENTVIVRDFDIANQYLQEFMARYNQFGGTSPPTVGAEPSGPIRSLSLAQSVPNPSRNGRTQIAYALPAAGEVSLRLFDLQGREMKALVDQRQSPGRYRVDVDTRGLANGVYFYRLKAGGVMLQRKMLLMR